MPLAQSICTTDPRSASQASSALPGRELLIAAPGAERSRPASSQTIDRKDDQFYEEIWTINGDRAVVRFIDDHFVGIGFVVIIGRPPRALSGAAIGMRDYPARRRSAHQPSQGDTVPGARRHHALVACRSIPHPYRFRRPATVGGRTPGD